MVAFEQAKGWGLVRGQFGAQPMKQKDGDGWLNFVKKAGYDGFEDASWEYAQRLKEASNNPALAREVAAERVALAREAGLIIFTNAVHLQGQALGDEPSLKTLQFIGGDALNAYKGWREAGNTPPRENPIFVPKEVGDMIHQEALAQLLGAVRISAAMSEIQGTAVNLPGFVGAPAHRWSHFFEFPPLPGNIAGYDIPDARKISGEIMVERFAPVWELCKSLGVKFGLECHPGEFASGDIASAYEFRELIRKAGFEKVVGFNFDGSHMIWQGVDPIQFIKEHRDAIFNVHLKGCEVAAHPTTNGLLGGFRPMGHQDNGWNFVTAGSPRDSINEGAVLTALRRNGYNGAVNVEWEDGQVDPRAGAEFAVANLRKYDLPRPPDGTRFDDALKAKV